MKRIIVIGGWLSLVVAMLTVPTSPAYAVRTTEHYRYQGQRAQTLNFGFDASGCIVYDVRVDAIKGAVKGTGQQDSTSQVFVTIGAFNYCTSELLPYLYGEVSSLPEAAIQIDKQLTAAHLDTIITVFDYDGNSFPVHLILDWTDMGPIEYRMQDHTQVVYPNVRFDSFEKRTRRMGSASGSMALGDTSIPLEPFFTPRCGGCGPLDLVDEGSLTITFSPNAQDWGITVATAQPNLSVPPTTTDPNQTRHYSFDGQWASAGIDVLDPTGCIITSSSVYAIKGIVKQTGHPDTSSVVSAYVSWYNVCTDEFLGSANGDATALPDTELQIDKQLNSAFLHTTLTVFDYTGSSFPVEFNVSWTGTGSIIYHLRDRSKVKSKLPHGYTSSEVSSRLADVSGSVSFGGTNMAANPNYSSGLLGSSKQGELTICHCR